MKEYRICEFCTKKTTEPIVFGNIFKKYFCSRKCIKRAEELRRCMRLLPIIGLVGTVKLFYDLFNWLKCRGKN